MMPKRILPIACALLALAALSGQTSGTSTSPPPALPPSSTGSINLPSNIGLGAQPGSLPFESSTGTAGLAPPAVANTGPQPFTGSAGTQSFEGMPSTPGLGGQAQTQPYGSQAQTLPYGSQAGTVPFGNESQTAPFGTPGIAPPVPQTVPAPTPTTGSGMSGPGMSGQ